MAAAVSGNDELTDLLLSKRADVTAKNHDGASALMFAAVIGFPNMARQLFEHGTDVNDSDNDGFTILTMASLKNNREVMQLLQDKCAKGEISTCCLRHK